INRLVTRKETKMKATKPSAKKRPAKAVRMERKTEMKKESQSNKRNILATDFGNAERFAELYGNEIRYCYDFRKWLIWDGTRWAEDNTGEIYRKGKDCIRRLRRYAANMKDEVRRLALYRYAGRCQTVTRLKAMVELTQSEPGLQVQQSTLDSNPWLLNVQNGTLDLQTGKFREHRREDFITKIIPTNYDPKATCREWNAFLEQVMPDNPDQIKFLQKAIGYSLTGSTKEQ